MTRSALRRYWFRRPVGFGYGVTAFTVADAEHCLAQTDLPRDWGEVIEDVDVSTLDAGHVLRNIGLVPVRGVWYPAFNLVYPNMYRCLCLDGSIIRGTE